MKSHWCPCCTSFNVCMCVFVVCVFVWVVWFLILIFQFNFCPLSNLAPSDQTPGAIDATRDGHLFTNIGTHWLRQRNTRFTAKRWKLVYQLYRRKTYFESVLHIITRPPHESEPMFNIRFSCFSSGLIFESFCWSF